VLSERHRDGLFVATSVMVQGWYRDDAGMTNDVEYTRQILRRMSVRN
jgi:hypothetical protein